jgi:hypothetical protein
VRESRPPGFVRGALSNECPYRDRDKNTIAESLDPEDELARPTLAIECEPLRI